MLIKYSYMGNGCCHQVDCAQARQAGQPCNQTDLPPPAYDDWNAYRADLDKALDETETSNRCGRPGGSAAAGFKLMYDQVPRAFITSGRFTRYLADRRVSVLHLVREATLLRVASIRQGGGIHSKNMTMARMTQADSKVRWKGMEVAWGGTGPFGGTYYGVHTPMHLAAAVQFLEAADGDWKKVLAFQTASLRSLYVAYEHLLSAAGYNDHMQRVSFFVFGGSSTATRRPARNASNFLLKLHKSTCESRIADFDSLRISILGTSTLAACNFITALNLAS